VEVLIWLEIAQLSVRFWSGQFFPEDRWPSLWAELYIKTVPATPQKCCQGTGHPSILDTQSGHAGGIFGGLHVDKMSLSKAAQEGKRLQYPLAMHSRRQRKFPGLQSFDELETHSGESCLSRALKMPTWESTTGTLEYIRSTRTTQTMAHVSSCIGTHLSSRVTSGTVQLVPSYGLAQMVLKTKSPA
jgi:hypothetical protein